MTGWGFWAVAASLALLVAAVLLDALRRPQGSPRPETDADLAVYKDQLAEIERDLGRGTIQAEEAARLRAEVGKRVIEADRARTSKPITAGPTSGRALAAVILALVLPGGLMAYWWLGAPGYPDMALEPRLAALDAGMAARPTQEEELVQIGTPRDRALDQELVPELAAKTDAAALTDAFRSRFEAGELQAAVRVQERIIALRGNQATSSDHANLALALVAEAQGYVSPEAEAELRASLQLDMTNELSRYLVGEMFLQGGRYDQTFRFWRPLAEGGAAGSPWVASIRERIEQVAELAGIKYALPPTEATGPSAGDVAAAQDMTPDERQAMIEGMVAQLSERLATEGGPVEDWNRLIRSLAVLDRTAEAQTIYDEARTRFEGQPAELSFLKQAAVESGLTP